MANTYFQFKQFIVHQEHTAMKVCTDACLFGAWVAQDKSLQNVNKILDIGAGTGLLSLMLAQATANQTSPPRITAVEIENDAAKEASANFTLSPWTERLHLVHQSIQHFSKKVSNEKFDIIISNPPFFESDLASPSASKNLAAHSMALSWEELSIEVRNLLSDQGYYYCLIPAIRAYTMQKNCATQGLALLEEVTVYNSAKQMPFRSLQKYGKLQEELPVLRSSIYIKDAQNEYTTTFKNLLQAYYLHL